MAVVDEYQASLGATELRAHASSLATDLARLGMGLALEERRAVDVLRWAERWRAGALSRPPVRPPDDDLLAAHLVELRQAQSDLRTAALGAPGVSEKAGPQKAGPQKTGREKGATAASRTMALRAQIAELEKAIRDQTRQAPDHAVATGRIEVAALRLALGPRCLVEYVALEGHLYAVTVSRDRTRLHDLGTSMVDDEKRYLLFALRRLWSSPLRRGAEDALAATAARVDAMLMTPLGLPPDAPLVVIPTGVLHGLPWSALPSVANRPTVVAPSAALWLGTAAQGHRPPEDSPPSGGRDRSKRRSAALVAGPGLPGADREVALIAEMYPGTVPLTGALATADAAMAALGTADVAHLAAHGRFRSDSPMFSSVLLADGPVTVYDLERLSHAPTVVVLASCDAAVSAVQLGDELLGTAAALIGIGVRSVIGPVMAVPDGATAAFMVALHRRLQAGDPPATALVSARAGQDRAIGDAFICIGCNDPATAAPEGVTATA
jgi:CHAT domain-containing protein